MGNSGRLHHGHELNRDRVGANWRKLATVLSPGTGTVSQGNQASQPLRFSRRVNRAASGRLGDVILGPSHSIRLPSPTRSATQPSKMTSARYAAISKLEYAGVPSFIIRNHSCM